MSRVAEYDPAQVSAVYDSRTITGFSDSSLIKIEFAEDAILPKVGGQGDTAVALNANKSGTVVFTLMQTSSSLSWLRQMAAARTRAQLTINEPSDPAGYVINSEDCYVLKVPSFATGKDIQDVEVTIWVPEINIG